MSAPGKVLKVLTVDSDGEKTGEWSQQLPADPFANRYEYSGLQQPPFSLEQLIFLAESHPTHAAVLEQKAADVVGTGWEWVSDEDKGGDDKDDSQRKELEAWFDGLADSPKSDQTTHEVLLSAWEDLETVGQGMIELARDPKGELRHWFRIPAHTCRFHRDGVRICQERQGKKVWFKRWLPGDERVVDAKSGSVYKDVAEAQAAPRQIRRANEILVLKRPSRRSTWYGVPTYIPATGWITLSTAARDDNIFFFENRREPRWAIILKNVEDDPQIEAKLKQALKVDLKKPHRNLVIPLAGDADIKFQQLGDNKGDLSWDKLQERADGAILLAHRMPGDRIGLTRVGALGGSVVVDATRVYKESFVQTSQSLLASRVNKLIQYEGPTSPRAGEVAKDDGVDAEGQDARAGAEPEPPKWRWEPTELDLTEEGAEQERAVSGFQGGVLTLNEAREKSGEKALPDDDERGAKFMWEVAPALAGALARAQAMEDSASIRVGGQQGAGGDQGQLAGATGDLAARIEKLLAEQPEGEDGGG